MRLKGEFKELIINHAGDREAGGGVGWGTSTWVGQVQVVIIVVINITIVLLITNTISIMITITLKMARYTDGSVAQGWVKEGAWHGVYRSKL